jgi:hypothetical protein
MKKATVLALLAAVLASAGCRTAPRIDLGRVGTIGLFQFYSTANGKLAEYAGRVFAEVVLRNQPGVRIKELGPADKVLGGIGASRLSQDALDAIRRSSGVDAIVVGSLDVSEVKPRVDLLSIIKMISVAAEVEAVMTARLIDTRDGTTIWTDSARARATVAHVSVAPGGVIFFDARDPEQAYGPLVRDLVRQTTRDIRRR